MDFELFSLMNNSLVKAQRTKDRLLQLNEKLAEYGLRLSEKDADMLCVASAEELRSFDRVEFGESVVPALAEAFADSPYISHDGFADDLAELIEIFYEVKEESLDLMTDAEILLVMRYFFDNVSQGCMELLRGRDMEELCRRIRNGGIE